MKRKYQVKVQLDAKTMWDWGDHSLRWPVSKKFIPKEVEAEDLDHAALVLIDWAIKNGQHLHLTTFRIQIETMIGVEAKNYLYEHYGKVRLKTI